MTTLPQAVRATALVRGGTPAEHGGTLPPLAIPFEMVGPPDAPVTVALGGISAGRHVSAHAGDRSPGWWEAIVGPGRAIDTTHQRVVSLDWITRDEGPTGTGDQAFALAEIIARLGRAAAPLRIVGASYGGMVALAFAARYPELVSRLTVISAAHESHPMATAVRALQRRIVRDGQAAGREREALAVARALAITTYRTAREFAGRFANEPSESARSAAAFPVERYLDHCGERFAERFDAARFLALSESLDRHRVSPDAIRVSCTLVAVRDDAIAPPWQVRTLSERLGAAARYLELDSLYGHDAFLKEPILIGRILEGDAAEWSAAA